MFTSTAETIVALVVMFTCGWLTAGMGIIIDEIQYRIDTRRKKKKEEKR